MREGGNDQPIDVAEDAIHRFTLHRRRSRELGFQITRLDGGQHRQIGNALEVVGNPIDKLVSEAAKVFLIHVAEVGCEACFGRCGVAHGVLSYTPYLRLRKFKEDQSNCAARVSAFRLQNLAKVFPLTIDLSGSAAYSHEVKQEPPGLKEPEHVEDK